uniref:Putative WD40-repeat-containing domain-containing protein n=1 Tax=Helianthus annuus TaxID=4232 RepID=A0A251SK62_HELAN
MWDRRASVHPQRVLTTKKITGLTSIQSLGDQCVYGGSESGFIYIWDLRRLRGGRSSTVFQSDKEVEQSRTYIRRKGIQSININSTCPYQLGFHLNDGWSGVLDMHNYRVSHIHCPPLPPWMLIYAVASTSSNGLHLLDFYPHSSSPCHVDYE